MDTKIKELNEKLARWAGFTYYDNEIVFGPNPPKVGWYYNNTFVGYRYQLPDFTNDLNACFKWLVPKLNNKGLYICIDQHDYGSGLVFEVIIVDRIGDDTTDLFTNNDLAKALTEAIEQVIDGESTSK